MIKYILALCIVTLGVRTVAAESYKLSLSDSIKMAVEKNNRIRAAHFTAEASHHTASAVTARYYPSISFEESLNISNSPTQTFMMKLDEGRFSQNDFLINNLNNPSTQHDFRTALTIRQPIFNPSISPLRTIADKESEIQDTNLQATKQETAFRVFKLYLDIQKAQARLYSAEQAVSEAREHLRLAEVRNKSGVGLVSDELRSRVHLSMNEQQLISAKNDMTIARMELANVIGLAENDNIEITDTKIFAVSLTQSPDELVSLSLENRNELKLSQAEYEKANAAVKLAWSSYLPSVDAFGTYQMNSKDSPFKNDNDSWNAGVSLTWQLFDGFKRYHERGKAVANKAAATELKEYSRREAGLRVRESYLRSVEMEKRLDVVSNSLKNAEETVRLLTRRFENSLATMVEVLDAQTALNQTRAELVDSQAHLALACGYVYFTAGTFMKEMTK